MLVYLLLIPLCYLSMIVYKELLSKKLMTAWHAIVPSAVFIAIIIIITPLASGGKIFSPFIYPSWFFELFGFIEIYLVLMLPMFFGAAYLDDRRKAWSAMIFPAALAIFMFVLFGGYLFYEMGWLLFYMLLFYLGWGIACALTPRFVWKIYVSLRDKLGGRILFGVVFCIVSAVFAIAVCAIIFTIAANIGKIEADYLPPHMINPPTTADFGENG